MFDAISFSPCQTELSSDHRTIFLIEDLKRAIEAKDLSYIFELKLRKSNWDWEDLIDVFNEGLYPLIEKNEAENNAFVITASQILFNDLSCRNSYLRYLFEVACTAGNIELSVSLKNHFSDWWESLETEELAFAMDQLVHTIFEGQNPQFIQSGKKEIYYLITFHPNWAPDSDTLPDLFPYLLNPNKMTVEPDELNRLACAFLKVPSLEETSVGLLSEVTKIVIKSGRRDFFKILTSLPNWNKIPPYSFASILSQQFEYGNQEDLSIFLSHPSWNKLTPPSLRKIASYYSDSEWILKILAQNHQWDKLSPDDLFQIVTRSFVSSETIELVTSHPAWTQMSRETLADLISCVGNRLSEENWFFFEKTMMHPRWSEITHQELSKILRWVTPRDEYSDRFIAKIKEHKNWSE